MKTIFNLLIIFATIFLFISSCAEKRDPFSVTTHPEGWNDINSPVFHGTTVIQFNSNLENCQSCHGTDYNGGTTNVSCKTSGCHVDAEGPEACNTCHGNEVNNAPPKDLAGNSNTSSVGVGAHQTHLVNNNITTAYNKNCSLCHIDHKVFLSKGHIDDTPNRSEVIFNAITSNLGNTNPQWSHDAATCSNTYCHGAFEFKKSDLGAITWAYTDSVITGNNKTVKWTAVGQNQAICGTCHGMPPKGHIGAANCAPCHGRVVDASNNIINKNLHINGQKDVF